MYYIYYYIKEIRLRVFYIFFALICSFLMAYAYKYEFFYILSKPILAFQKNFIFFNFTEGLSIIISIVSIVSFFIIIPLIIYHFWGFNASSWYNFERKKYRVGLSIFCLCILIEVLWIYLFAFPKICEFLISFEMKSNAQQALLNLEFTPRITSYINLFFKLVIFVATLFQLPFLFLGLFSKKIINCYQLCQYRKLIFFLSVLTSAFVSPPDIFSQIFLCINFYCLYEFIILLGFYQDVKI